MVKDPGAVAAGASVSPLLANVYLRYVLDLWAEWWRRRHARGRGLSRSLPDKAASGVNGVPVGSCG